MDLTGYRHREVIVPATIVGGYIGGKIAVKKGNKFVMDTMIVLIVVSAGFLIFGSGKF